MLKDGRKRGLEAFGQLSEEKKQRILKAAMAEFTRHGYEAASTNHIARNADIGKGMLFHYFESKEKLFLFCFNYVLETYNQDQSSWIGSLPAEPFQRAMQWTENKFLFYLNNPVESQFLAHSYLTSGGALREKLEKIYREDSRKKKELFSQGIDFSYFREGIDKEKALEVFFAVLERMQQSLLNQYWIPDTPFPFAELRSEIESYLEIVKHGILQ